MKKQLSNQNKQHRLSKVELLELEVNISHYFLNNPLTMLKHSLENLCKACAKNNEMGITDIEKTMQYLKLMDATFEDAHRFFCLNRSVKKPTALITNAKLRNHGK